MITWVRSAMITSGVQAGAIEWAIRMSAYVNEKYGLNVSVQRNVAGPSNQIHWVANHDSLASLEELTAALMQDEGYAALLAESSEGGFFDANSVTDSLYRTIG